MSFSKRLFVGMALFVFVIGGFLQLIPATAFAVTVTSENQARKFAETIKTSDADTITGKLGDTTIVFKKKNATGPNGLPATGRSFEAQNLDCNGEKATIGVNDTLKLSTLTLKFKENNSCSKALQILLNLSQDGNIEGVSDQESGNGGDACESGSSGALGWILCPVIEMGVSFSELVFNEFVTPFLQEVPVTTNPDDPSYTAWKQFRVIGNIVLIGTLLAVVYSQIKGSR